LPQALPLLVHNLVCVSSVAFDELLKAGVVLVGVDVVFGDDVTS